MRALASVLGVSPGTVAASYRELTRRGIVIGEKRRGTRVRPSPPVSGRLPMAVPAGVVDLRTGGPDPSLLPALPRVGGRGWSGVRSYGEAPASPRLTEIAAAHLSREGIDTARLAVVGGALDGVERVLGAWLRPGDRVAVEDPGYTAVIDLLSALGMAMVPVGTDRLGAVPGELERALSRGATATVVTPRAQNPTGAAFDERRALEVREVLERHPDVLVIEDDHAGPAAGVSLHTVCHGRYRWATIRSVSKWLGPDLRLAVVAGDPTTVSRVEGRQALGTGWVSHLLQGIVAELWSDASVEAALADAASTYSKRRRALVSALAGEGIDVDPVSGLTAWVPVPDEHAVVAGMLERGYAVSPGERFRIESPSGVRIAFASLTESEAPAVAAAFGQILHQRSVRTG